MFTIYANVADNKNFFKISYDRPRTVLTSYVYVSKRVEIKYGVTIFKKK